MKLNYQRDASGCNLTSQRRAIWIIRKLPLAILPYAAFCLSPAASEEISTDTTEPVQTSTINSGAPDDITITDDGSITLSGTENQVAISVDSDNSVTNNGLIQIDDTDNVNAITVEAGRTATIVNNGTILIQEDYTRTDDDDDDDIDGALAIGSGRTGILLEAGGPNNGSVTNGLGSSISIEGNDSAGIRLLSELNGDLINDGTITLIGDNTVGIEVADGVTGDVLISGGVSVQGEDATAILLNGDIGGNLTLESSVVATGFVNTGITNYISPILVDLDTPVLEDRIDAEDLAIGGSALAIGGSLGSGLLINGSVDDFISDEDLDDETKDTIEDFDENRASGAIISIGSAPALLISPDLHTEGPENIVLGQVTETVRDTLDDDNDDDLTEVLATFDYDQGLINRGTISGNGLNVGYDATGLQISGSIDGQYSTEIVGGILNTGLIQSDAYEASATAIGLDSGSTIGTIDNQGTIRAGIETIDGDQAIAIAVDNGAALSSIINSGLIQATTVGDSGIATAIQDLSGGLTDLENQGIISASITENGLDETDTGSAIALDVSGSAQDFTLKQYRQTPTEDTNSDDLIDNNDVTTPVMVGDILFGSGNDVMDISAGFVTGNTDFGSGDGALSLSSATYTGDVLFNSGTNAMSLSNTTFTGDASFLGGTSSLDLSSGSVFEGRLVSTGGLSSFTATDSNLLFSSDTAAVVDSFSISGDSMLQAEIDSRISNGDAILTVNGQAVIGDDVIIRPVLTTITSTDFVQTIIDADDINFSGMLDTALIADAPFIYDVTLSLTDGVADTLDLEFALKSAETLGLDLNQTAAYSAVLDVFSSDDDLGAALATITEEDDFIQTYDLLLPQRTDASTRYLAAQSSAAAGALGNRLKAIDLDVETVTGGWVQEFFTRVDIDDDQDVPGYNGSGLGFAAGYDRKLAFIDVLGLFGSYSSGEFEEKTGGNNPVSTSSIGLGAYLKDSLGPFDITASAHFGDVDFYSRRELTLGGLPYEIEGQWGGTSATASLGLSSSFDVGKFYVRPIVSFDYFGLSQDGYSETGNDSLALEIAGTDTERTSATAMLDLGARFVSGRNGENFWAPELSLGFRSAISSTPYETQARFLGSDETFLIQSQETFSDAVLAGLALNTGSQLLSARVGYDIEIADEGLIHYGGATLRLKF